MVTGSVSDFAFDPMSEAVALGTIIIWTNQGPSSHTVTADDGSFDSGVLPTGGTFSMSFATAGSFTYHCNIYPSMTGSITVG